LRNGPLKLNIAAVCSATKVLGPGTRFALWVQGCCFSCTNCSTPEWREQKEEMLITPKELSRQILETPGIEGITISGGESMLQAEALHKLVKHITSLKPLSIICYTGFTIEGLKEQGDANIDDFLTVIDVLIDGPYIDSLNDNRGLRGSTNQRIHFLSDVYKDRAEVFINSKRDIELHLLQNEYLVVGLKPRGMQKLKL